ncbi:hypothetical protein LTR17_015617 [Elasticomyces elasticus]|nr:hypothetical protein LTR17_015617 [Elasticomyces elasticus]
MNTPPARRQALYTRLCVFPTSHLLAVIVCRLINEKRRREYQWLFRIGTSKTLYGQEGFRDALDQVDPDRPRSAYRRLKLIATVELMTVIIIRFGAKNNIRKGASWVAEFATSASMYGLQGTRDAMRDLISEMNAQETK